MRAWIVGNGPSLRYTPLELLQKEDTFAVNNIRKIFPYTTWRPKYYVRTDDLYDDQKYDDTFKDVLGEISSVIEEGAYAFLGPYFYYEMSKKYPGVVHGILPICGEQMYHVGDKGCPDSWHMRNPKSITEYCSFGGALHVAIQVACFEMGNRASYDAIYLVGCDMGFDDDGGPHFVSDYFDSEIPDPVPGHILQADKIHAHEIAKRCSPIPIFNATIGGELEVYPRVDIMEVLCQ